MYFEKRRGHCSAIFISPRLGASPALVSACYINPAAGPIHLGRGVSDAALECHRNVVPASLITKNGRNDHWVV